MLQVMTPRRPPVVPGYVFVIFGVLVALAVLWVWVDPLWAQRPLKSEPSVVTPPASTAQPATPSNHAIAPGAQPTSIDLRVAAVEERLRASELQLALQTKALDFQRERLAIIDSTAKFILTIAAVFAGLLGFASWRSLEDQRKSAETNLEQQLIVAKGRIEHELSDANMKLNAELETARTRTESALSELRQLRDDLARDFPMFGRMRRNFTGVLLDLQATCANLKAQDDAYRLLTTEQQQRVQFYEKAVAWSLLLETGESTRTISDMFRYLGVFYASRYTVALMGTHDPDAIPNRNDLHRARFYFQHAINLDPGNYFTYSHGGMFMMWYRDKELARCSRDWLKQAAELGKTKQRPLVNLAILELAAFEDPESAIAALDRADHCTEYEEDKSKPHPERVSYLRACALAFKAGRTSDESAQAALYSQAMELLSVLPVDAWITDSLNVADGQGAPDREAYFSQLSKHPAFAGDFANVMKRFE